MCAHLPWPHTSLVRLNSLSLTRSAGRDVQPELGPVVPCRSLTAGHDRAGGAVQADHTVILSTMAGRAFHGIAAVPAAINSPRV
jgi:hypothetical protein